MHYPLLTIIINLATQTPNSTATLPVAISILEYILVAKYTNMIREMAANGAAILMKYWGVEGR